jgi:hypothetical protein
MLQYLIMKNFLFVLVFLSAGCNCTRTDNASTTATNNLTDTKAAKDTIPPCITALIKKLQTEPVTNPPSKIYRYTFEGKAVYYVPAVCCDNFSDLYNDSCKIMAHPDGGFTGKGDRKAPTFQEEKKNEKLIWEDLRKQ